MKIYKVNLKTGKLKNLHNFYSSILEMDTTVDHQNSFTVKAGITELFFEEDKGHSNAFYHFAFNIPENQLSGAITWLDGKVELISLDGESIFDFKAWDAHSIYFYDPAGNIIEFIARHKLNTASNKPFSGKSILSVSEIGLPVKNVKEFYNEIYNKLHIPLFTGDLKTFTAAGNDEGLLIIVPEQRHWFPDCPRSKIFPLEIEIEGNENKELEFTDLNYTIKTISN